MERKAEEDRMAETVEDDWKRGWRNVMNMKGTKKMVRSEATSIATSVTGATALMAAFGRWLSSQLHLDCMYCHEKR